MANPQQKQKSVEVTFSVFLKITIVLCLVNILTVTRIYVYTDSIAVAQSYYDKAANKNQNLHHFFVPQITSVQDLSAIFTDLRLEQSYLLPFSMQIGAILIVVIPFFKTKGFVSLLGLLLPNLIAYIALIVYPSNFTVYRITHMVHCALMYPMITLSSLSVMKTIPNELVPIKSYYSFLMFVLPQLGRIIASIFFSASLEAEPQPILLLQSRLRKLLTAGSILTFLAFLLILENRKKIQSTLQQRLTNAIENAMAQSSQEDGFYELDRDFLKSKMKMQYETLMFGKKQALKIFQKPDIGKGADKQKRQQMAVNALRENIGLLIMCWGAAFAVSSHVMDLRKQLFTNLSLSSTLTGSPSEYESTLTQSNVIPELIILALIINVSFFMINMIQNSRIDSLKLILFSMIIGYASLIVLFLISNKILPESINLIHTVVIVCRCSFFVFILPAMFDIQHSGISAFEGFNIMSLISWALGIMLRVFLMVFQVSTKVFILAFIIVVCSFYIERVDKKLKSIIEEPIQYNKISDFESGTSMHEQEQTIEDHKHSSTQQAKSKPNIAKILKPASKQPIKQQAVKQ